MFSHSRHLFPRYLPLANVPVAFSAIPAGHHPYTVIENENIVCFNKQSHLLDTFQHCFVPFTKPSKGLCFRGTAIKLGPAESLTDVIFGSDCLFARLNSTRTAKSKSMTYLNSLWKSEFEFRGAGSPVTIHLELVLLSPYLLIRESGQKWFLWKVCQTVEMRLCCHC
jgi:hypothetical protein